MTNQQSLAGFKAEVGELLHLDIRQLIAPVGVKAPAGLTDSVRRHGVLEPILVAASYTEHDGEMKGRIRFTILAGRRRFAAAWEAGLTEIPARVVRNASAVGGSAITLTENATRSANIVAEWDAIEALFASGETESEVAAATGIAVATIRRRLVLRRLIPALADKLRAGEMSGSVAERAARLDPARQQDLASRSVGGRLTASDVREVRMVQAAEQTALLPAEVFDTPAFDPYEAAIEKICEAERILNAAGSHFLALAALENAIRFIQKGEDDERQPDGG